MKAAPGIGTEDQLFEWGKQPVNPDEKKERKGKASMKQRECSSE
jgi:hypothetical protein